VEATIGLMSASSTGYTNQPITVFGPEDAVAQDVGSLFRSSFPIGNNRVISPTPVTNIWSPNGEWFAFVDKTRDSPNTQLVRIRHDGTYRKTLYTGTVTTANPSFNAWSLDSQWIIFSVDSDIYRVSIDGQITQALTTMEGQEQYLGLSQDGQWIYFDATGSVSTGVSYGLYRVRIDRSDMQLLSAQRMGYIGESPDGEWVYRYEILSTGGYAIYRLNLRTQQQEHVTDDLSSNFFEVWTPDNESLIITTLNRSGMTQLTKLSAYTNQRVSLGTARESIDVVAIAPNSEWLFYRGIGGNPTYNVGYEAVNLITGETLNYTGLIAQDSRLVGWSPDSQWLIVGESTLQNNEVKWRLAKMRIDGAAHEALTPYTNRLRYLGWWQIPRATFDVVHPIGFGFILLISGFLMMARAKRRHRIG
jgi:Tol biopolymer transport system component